MPFSPHLLEPRVGLLAVRPQPPPLQCPLCPPTPLQSLLGPSEQLRRRRRGHGLSQLSLVPGYLLYTYPSGLDAPSHPANVISRTCYTLNAPWHWGCRDKPGTPRGRPAPRNGEGSAAESLRCRGGEARRVKGGMGEQSWPARWRCQELTASQWGWRSRGHLENRPWSAPAWRWGDVPLGQLRGCWLLKRGSG